MASQTTRMPRVAHSNDAMKERRSVTQPSAILRKDTETAAQGLRGEPRQMRRDDDIRQLKQGVRNVYGFGMKDVQARRPQPAAAQRAIQRLRSEERRVGKEWRHR